MKDNEPAPRLKFFKKITVRIPLIILILLSIGIGITVYYYSQSQSTTIIKSREKAVLEESDVIAISVRNFMIPGHAPLAIKLFSEFSRSKVISDIKLYRINGTTAFSDNKTLNNVNHRLGRVQFKPKPKDQFLKNEINMNEKFKESLAMAGDVSFLERSTNEKQLVVYRPLLNLPECNRCHGTEPSIRGVVKIASSVNTAYKQANESIIISIIIYGLTVFLLTVTIILIINRIVIKRILKVGQVVEGVGNGDFKTKLKLPHGDELGVLAVRINSMIDGLRERFRLSKFVSHSTLEHIKSDQEISVGGEKREVTVFFSDIRGFTSYSEKRDPADVMQTLNETMNFQSDVVHEYGGDIDKFVGDELMAIFEGEDMVLRAVLAAEKIRNYFREEKKKNPDSVAVGIGINTGEVILGNMGSSERLDRTVIGDHVNLGARLCSAAGKNTVVISEFSYKYIKGKIIVHEHDPIRVKGKQKPVKIYSLKGVR